MAMASAKRRRVVFGGLEISPYPPTGLLKGDG